MANELHYYGIPSTQSGLTVIARVYDNTGTQVGSDVSTTESGSLAIYTGDMPTASAGQYGVRFFQSGQTDPLGTSYIDWDGSAEVTLATIAAQAASILSAVNGLNNFDPSNDTVARVTLVDTTTVNTDMRGTDGANTTTPPTASENAIAVENAILNELDGRAVIDAIVQAIGNENITATAIASEVWSSALDGAYEAQELMRLIASATAGKVSVAGAQFSFRDLADSKDRIVAATNSTGERTAVTLDAS
ncbi:MAG: hypothetical protein AAFO74_12995 [Pseudomonadota bacterium]